MRNKLCILSFCLVMGLAMVACSGTSSYHGSSNQSSNSQSGGSNTSGGSGNSSGNSTSGGNNTSGGNGSSGGSSQSGTQPAPPTLTSVSATPSTAAVVTGTSVSLHATGTYSDNTTKDLTTVATWVSSSPNVVAVSAAGVATGVTSGTATVTASSGGFSASVTITVTAATLSVIQVSPTNPAIPVNTTQQLTATGKYSDGSTRDVTAVVSWNSSTIASVTVSAAGVVTGVAGGSATITATLDSISGSTSVIVTAPIITSISLAPSDMTLAIGVGEQFTASAIYSDGSIQDLVAGVTWSSSDPTVAVVDNNGLATTLAAGTTTITATVGSFTDSATITVVPAHLLTITLTPANVTMAPGTSQQFTATGNFDDGSTQVLTSASWSSSATSALTIDATGLGHAVAAGTSTVTVTAGTVSATASVTVTNATLVSLAIAPLNSTMPAGAVKQFTATGTFSDNSTQDMTQLVLWGSSNVLAASIDNTGLATSVAVGTTTITASVGSVSQSTTLTVSTVRLVSITISPANPTVERHTSLKFTATGTYSDGSTATLTSVSWRSSKNNLANMRGSGILHAKKTGTLTLTASAYGVAGTTTVTIGSGTLVSVAITPASPSVSAGSTQQFVATGTFSDGSTQDVTINSHWSSTVPSVATIANAPVSAGLATTFTSGATTINVNHSGIVATGATLSVN